VKNTTCFPLVLVKYLKAKALCSPLQSPSLLCFPERSTFLYFLKHNALINQSSNVDLQGGGGQKSEQKLKKVEMLLYVPLCSGIAAGSATTSGSLCYCLVTNTVRSDARTVERRKEFLWSRQTHVINNSVAHSLSWKKKVEIFTNIRLGEQIMDWKIMLVLYYTDLCFYSSQRFVATNRFSIMDLDRNQ
jgi:hypothetical protein